MSKAPEQSIRDAAKWLAENEQDHPRPIFPVLKEHFSLSAKDAVRAVQLYQKGGCDA